MAQWQCPCERKWHDCDFRSTQTYSVIHEAPTLTVRMRRLLAGAGDIVEKMPPDLPSQAKPQLAQRERKEEDADEVKVATKLDEIA